MTQKDGGGVCARLKSALSVFTNVSFLLYCVAMLATPFCISNVYVYVPSYLEEHGRSKSTAALLVSLTGVTSIAGRCVCGDVYRWHTQHS